MELVLVIILSVVLVFLAFLGLGLRILFKRGGKFPNFHVSGNKYLRRNGIFCAQTQDRMERSGENENIDYNKVKMIKLPKSE